MLNGVVEQHTQEDVILRGVKIGGLKVRKLFFERFFSTGALEDVDVFAIPLLGAR